MSENRRPQGVIFLTHTAQVMNHLPVHR